EPCSLISPLHAAIACIPRRSALPFHLDISDTERAYELFGIMALSLASGRQQRSGRGGGSWRLRPPPPYPKGWRPGRPGWHRHRGFFRGPWGVLGGAPPPKTPRLSAWRRS